MTSPRPWVLGLWSKGPSAVYAAGIEFLSIDSLVAATQRNNDTAAYLLLDTLLLRCQLGLLGCNNLRLFWLRRGLFRLRLRFRCRLILWSLWGGSRFRCVRQFQNSLGLFRRVGL